MRLPSQTRNPAFGRWQDTQLDESKPVVPRAEAEDTEGTPADLLLTPPCPLCGSSGDVLVDQEHRARNGKVECLCERCELIFAFYPRTRKVRELAMLRPRRPSKGCR